MTSPISAVSAVSGVSGVGSITPTTGVAAASGTDTDFAGMLSKCIESVQASQTNADNLAVQVANGTLTDPAQYTMAATEASLGLSLTMAIRNKAVDAFQEIMRMQA